MVQRIGGIRRKSRDKLKKGLRQKGKFNLTRFFQTLENGDKVVLIADSTYQRGSFSLRFYNAPGIIKGKQGRCYKVNIVDGGKRKELIVHPIHLRKL